MLQCGRILKQTSFCLARGSMAVYSCSGLRNSPIFFFKKGYTVENKDEYLVNDYHLNEKGIEAIADRFYYFFGDSL